MIENRRIIPLTRAREQYDKRGKDSRAPVLRQSIEGGQQINLAAAGAHGIVRNTGGMKTVSWQSQNDRPEFGGLILTLIDPSALSASMVETFWIQTGDTSPSAGGTVASPPIPIGTNLGTGFQWNMTLFPVFYPRPLRETIIPASSRQYNSITYTLELLDAAGTTLKTCTQQIAYDSFYTVATDQTVFSESRGVLTHDDDPAIPVFYGLKLTTTSSGTPAVSSPLCNLTMYESQVTG